MCQCFESKNNSKKKHNIQTRASKEFKMWTIDISILHLTYFFILYICVCVYIYDTYLAVLSYLSENLYLIY